MPGCRWDPRGCRWGWSSRCTSLTVLALLRNPTAPPTLCPMDWREIPYEVWRRATEVQPTPDWRVVAVLGAVTLLVVASPLWPSVRMLATITHEGGHALGALLTGRRLPGIRLHRDTPGVPPGR